jgi:hypothetical protein
VLSRFILPTRCGWVFGRSRAPDRRFGSHLNNSPGLIRKKSAPSVND